MTTKPLHRWLRLTGKVALAGFLLFVIGLGGRTYFQLQEKEKIANAGLLWSLKAAQDTYAQNSHSFYVGPVEAAPFYKDLSLNSTADNFSLSAVTATEGKGWQITLTRKPPCSPLYGCYGLTASGPDWHLTSNSKRLNDEQLP